MAASTAVDWISIRHVDTQSNGMLLTGVIKEVRRDESYVETVCCYLVFARHIGVCSSLFLRHPLHNLKVGETLQAR